MKLKDKPNHLHLVSCRKQPAKKRQRELHGTPVVYTSDILAYLGVEGEPMIVFPANRSAAMGKDYTIYYKEGLKVVITLTDWTDVEIVLPPKDEFFRKLSPRPIKDS